MRVRRMASEVKNIIWMIWKNREGEPFKVGELCKDDEKYYFKYDIDGVKRAEEYGFLPLPYFPRTDAEYFREELFQSFLNRLPGHGKRDKNSVLKEYKLDKYDAFELLKRSGGKISKDSFEFVVPFDVEDTQIDFK